jgi:hypothetical protein
MLAFLSKLQLILRSRLRSRARLEAGNLVLRRQVLILSRKSPGSAGLSASVAQQFAGSRPGALSVFESSFAVHHDRAVGELGCSESEFR